MYRIGRIRAMKGKERIAMLTCYDYSFARAMQGTCDILLVGDSLGNVVLGFDRTRHVLIEDMVRHVAAVRRGAPETTIVADLPFGSYETEADAIASATRLVEAGADAVKPEGKPWIVKALCVEGFPVVAHLGLLPQTAERMVVQGKDEEDATSLVADAKAMEEAGAFSLILECVPAALAGKITAALTIPTIGIGAGSQCDGQVLVSYDLLGLYPTTTRFVRQYASLSSDICEACQAFSSDVKKGTFPSEKETLC